MATAEEIEYRCKSWRTWQYICYECGKYTFADTEPESKAIAAELATAGWQIRNEEELLCPTCYQRGG